MPSCHPTPSSSPLPDWNSIRDRFRQIWGYDDFRSPQGEIIHSLLAGHDALVVMPTGGGKSICFQLPALMQQGLTIVVSPLLALMENQVQELRDRRLPAALLHSQLSGTVRKQTLRAIEQEKLRLLYVSPETLLSPPLWERLCRVQVNGLILDEAHCLVQWGTSFRPAYQRLGAVRSALLQHQPAGRKLPIAAFTATADPQTQQTIQSVLALQQPQLFLQSPYRSNLQLTVQIAWTPRGRRRRLLKFIQARPRTAGLVYVRTRQDSETIAQWLSQQGLQTAAYHAGLSARERRSIEQQWLSGALPFVICTNAFGMGINHPQVRWIVHFQPPLWLSEYVQEIGRAGRDGQTAESLLLVSEPTGWLDPTDRQRHRYFIQQLHQQHQAAQALAPKLPPQGEVETIARQYAHGAIALAWLHSAQQLVWLDPFRYQLRRSRIERSQLQPFAQRQTAPLQMQRYRSARQCRWVFLLQAFGFQEDADRLRRCGHCDRCQPSRR